MMKQRTNDEWIVELKEEGLPKQEALADLREILYKGLKRGLVDWVNTSGPEFEPLADDFVQEALLKVLANIDSFGNRSKFTTWAHKIAVRVALTELRRKRWKDHSLDEMSSADSPFYKPFADTNPTPEDVTEQQDMMAKVGSMIANELTPRQMKAMQLVPIGGMPVEEAARQMGMNRNAMYKLLHDARLRLKKKLLEEGLTPANVMASFR